MPSIKRLADKIRKPLRTEQEKLKKKRKVKKKRTSVVDKKVNFYVQLSI